MLNVNWNVPLEVQSVEQLAPQDIFRVKEFVQLPIESGGNRKFQRDKSASNSNNCSFGFGV